METAGATRQNLQQLGDATVSITIIGTSIEGNMASQGGGIVIGAFGQATIVDSSVSDNTASSGAGIKAVGSLTLVRSTVSGNAGLNGAGIYFDTGNHVVMQSDIIVNTAATSGGGIWNRGDVTVSNSTISGNSGGDGLKEWSDGGAIWSNGSVTLVNVTITDSSAGNDGGAIRNANGGTIALTNTIIADQVSGGDCKGTVPTSLGHNLDSDGSCGLTEAGDISAGSANLGPLASNGGPTLTHALLEGSDAIEAGDDDVCAAEPVNGVDQRGTERPQGKACDIGAFELVPGVERFWGDADCDKNVAIGDALKTARYLLGLGVSQEPGCPEIGSDVTADGVGRVWGDIDCDDSLAIGDALKVARWLLGLSVSQEEGCPEIGTEVEVAEMPALQPVSD